ncbi:hypothetical protein V501_00727 [Pseudogymnoascus sp. VKM F-4519 (FW-2642)]|nr:hypothetical protein V501_00727 [Pseudogymnoascus sp. VKM F-4519 (FW-2642)]
MSYNVSSTHGRAQSSRNISVTALLAAIGIGIASSAVQILIFTLIKDKLSRIYQPKTYLVPERQRTSPPPRGAFRWIASIFTYKDTEIINKCGLDAYFFLRYLQTLLFIFVPLACLLLPILLPLNYLSGRNFAASDARESSDNDNIPAGLDVLAWGNISPNKTSRYWIHLILAVVVVIWICCVFFAELRVYVRVRRDYLTSAEHRLRASATTVLVTDIPSTWLTVEALSFLYDVFPGGIRNIWINRDHRKLLRKVRAREGVVAMLESAETELIKRCKQAQLKQQRELASNNTLQYYTTREEEENSNIRADQIAKGEGKSSGNLNQIHQSIEEAVEAAKAKNELDGWRSINKATTGSLATIGKGFSRGLRLVGRVEETVIKNTENATKVVDNIIETTNGFYDIKSNSPKQEPSKNWPRTYISHHNTDYKNAEEPTHSRIPYSFGAITENSHKDAKHRWWKFWNGPSGSFPSPLPHGYEKIANSRGKIPGASGLAQIAAQAKSKVRKGQRQKYPPHVDYSYKEDEAKALWSKYIKKTDRSTHRIPRFGISFLPYICPWINKKVDTIYWCREELARLNVEIEYDQDHSDNFPRANSAFIQFNQQIAAHMAVQVVSHHTPMYMAHRMVEVSPTDIIWDNMSIKWWESWLRNSIVFIMAACMCLLWAIPVSATALLGNIPELAKKYHWLGFLTGGKNTLAHVAGILPAIVLAILKVLPPVIFYHLTALQGNRTGSLRELSVQNYYFFFLFVQVFLVVSISNGAFATLARTGSVTSVPTLMAQNLPKASNYFFSYMIIQALSTSASHLLQVSTLIMWFLMPEFLDNTARRKWKRNTTLSTINWGVCFPTYTNFACITIIYSAIAPLIMVFAIITFTVLWIANRYCMLYVYNYTEDTGGLLYPRAINQTFVGLYFMEICLIGLFLLVRDSENNTACLPQALIMVVVMIVTALFQILLDRSFGPLYEHLPVTLEDDAVLRDKAFERAHAASIIENGEFQSATVSVSCDDDIWLRGLRLPATNASDRSRSGVGTNITTHTGTSSVAIRPRNPLITTSGDPDRPCGGHRKAMSEALFSGHRDEIEDLKPTERNALVSVAFEHEALRAMRPNVWVPQDDLGVSDQEVQRTEEFCKGNVWITNKGAALNSRLRVIYGTNPPDFTELDMAICCHRVTLVYTPSSNTACTESSTFGPTSIPTTTVNTATESAYLPVTDRTTSPTKSTYTSKYNTRTSGSTSIPTTTVNAATESASSPSTTVVHGIIITDSTTSPTKSSATSKSSTSTFSSPCFAPINGCAKGKNIIAQSSLTKDTDGHYRCDLLNCDALAAWDQDVTESNPDLCHRYFIYHSYCRDDYTFPEMSSLLP